LSNEGSDDLGGSEVESSSGVDGLSLSFGSTTASEKGLWTVSEESACSSIFLESSDNSDSSSPADLSCELSLSPESASKVTLVESLDDSGTSHLSNPFAFGEFVESVSEGSASLSLSGESSENSSSSEVEAWEFE
jgi:hypothetical protein